MNESVRAIRIVASIVLLCAFGTAPHAAGAPAAATPGGVTPQPSAPAGASPRLILLGPGDSVSMQVYGQPNMNTTVYVGDDGTIRVPLAGAVKVSGMTPVQAAQVVEMAYKDGGFLNDPHVSIGVVESRSQRVSVLGEVRVPGRYPVDPNTTIFDLLAQAGGAMETAADFVYLMRPDGKGSTTRTTVNLKGFSNKDEKADALPTQMVKGGDEIYVPRAEQFYIYGEVMQPNMYRVEPGMTVIQAIARAGGITPRGTERRVQIKRLGKDKQYVVMHAKPGDLVQADDVIRVSQSIF